MFIVDATIGLVWMLNLSYNPARDILQYGYTALPLWLSHQLPTGKADALLRHCRVRDMTRRESIGK